MNLPPARLSRSERFVELAVPTTRWLLGIQCLLSGLNWWYKILPFPNLFDPPGMPVKSAIVGAMIASGWMFTAAKAVEVALGLALLWNRYVPLMLVVAFPVLLMTFLLDAMIGPALLGWLQGTVAWPVLWAKLLDATYFGGAVIVMHLFLMLAYADAYKPLLASRRAPRFGFAREHEA